MAHKGVITPQCNQQSEDILVRTSIVNEACDQYVLEHIRLLEPEYLIGVGAYAEKCLQRICRDAGISPIIGKILHPSPASPAANKGWPHKAIEQLSEIGIW